MRASFLLHPARWNSGSYINTPASLRALKQLQQTATAAVAKAYYVEGRTLGTHQ
jgi:hypothetical protein